MKTPFLDSLAADGVRYDNAYSACPTCVPARAALYTGMSQRKTGREEGYSDGKRLIVGRPPRNVLYQAGR